MRSAIDIILARQHATLQHSIAELRHVLDQDDDWRALAALESVGEAAVGVSGQAWMARRQELKSALATNPIYRLYGELERALAVVSQTVGDGQDHVALAGDQSQTPAPTPVEQEVFTAELPREETVLQGVVALEPRRESIALRIATLAMPPLNANAEESPAGLLNPDHQAACETPAESVVAAATQSIVAALAVSVPGRSDVAIPSGQPVLADDELSPASLHMEEFVIGANDAGPEPDDAEPSRPAIGRQFDHSPSPPELEPGVIEIDAEVAPLLSVAQSDEDAALFGEGDDCADIDFDDFNEDDFEAEVSIVTRASPPQPAAPAPTEASAKLPSIEIEDGAGQDHETLEQRLQRLDRQSEHLLQPHDDARSATSVDDDLERANKWLEMIRARRANAALAANTVLYTEFERSPVTAAIAPVAPPSIPESLKSEPEWMQGLDSADDLDIVGGIEAEVKIVQRRSTTPHSRGPVASPLAPTQGQRSPRTAPVPRDHAIEPAVSFAGGIEEASVEIVRHTGSVKARAEDMALSPDSENTKLIASRFIRALTGE